LTETLRKTLVALTEMRDIDRELGRLRNRCRECPAIIEKHRLDFEAEGVLVEAKTKEINDRKIDMRRMEVELKACEEEVTRLSKQLLVAKTNQEYSAFQSQIERINGEKSGFETKILEILDGLEETEKELAEAVSENKVREAEFLELKASLENDLGEYNGEVEVLESKRVERIYPLDPEALKSYNRVLNALGGDGIVSLENHNCSGCYMAVTHNDYARIFAMKEVVLCKSCQRILYVPELLEPKE
jgi:uncharacterized protein